MRETLLRFLRDESTGGNGSNERSEKQKRVLDRYKEVVERKIGLVARDGQEVFLIPVSGQSIMAEECAYDIVTQDQAANDMSHFLFRWIRAPQAGVPKHMDGTAVDLTDDEACRRFFRERWNKELGQDFSPEEFEVVRAYLQPKIEKVVEQALGIFRRDYLSSEFQ